MERTVGPIDGYYAAIFARELGGTFRASYKVCAIPPADYGSARPLRHKRVDGAYHTLKEAFDIAEQLARLQIARLTDKSAVKRPEQYAATVPAELDSLLGDDNSSFDSGPLYAATEPAPLYQARGD